MECVTETKPDRDAKEERKVEEYLQCCAMQLRNKCERKKESPKSVLKTLLFLFSIHFRASSIREENK
jgi:hypothetical protein